MGKRTRSKSDRKRKHKEQKKRKRRSSKHKSDRKSRRKRKRNSSGDSSHESGWESMSDDGKKERSPPKTMNLEPAIQLVSQMVDLYPELKQDLLSMMSRIDSGDTVDISSLESETIKQMIGMLFEFLCLKCAQDHNYSRSSKTPQNLTRVFSTSLRRGPDESRISGDDMAKSDKLNIDLEEAKLTIAELLSKDSSAWDEIHTMLTMIDNGEEIDIGGIEDREVKRLLAQMMRAFGLIETENVFRSTTTGRPDPVSRLWSEEELKIVARDLNGSQSSPKPKSTANVSEIGPSLGPSSSLEEENYTKRKQIGPAIPDASQFALSERLTAEGPPADEDMVGPSLPGRVDPALRKVGEMRADALAEQRRLKKLDERERASGKSKRESWMTELPEQSRKIAEVTGRTFSSREMASQDSSWTDTPEDRKRKALEQITKGRSVVGGALRTKSSRQPESSSSNRPKSLLELHQESIADEKKASKKKPMTARDRMFETGWTRDRLAEGQVDSAAVKKAASTASKLMNRFSSGS
eukprot:246589_1